MPLSEEQRKMLEDYLRKQQAGSAGVEVPEAGMVAPTAPSARMVAPSPGTMGAPPDENNALAMRRNLMKQQAIEAAKSEAEDEAEAQLNAPAPKPFAEIPPPPAEEATQESEEERQRKAKMSAMRNLAFGQQPQVPPAK